MENKNTTQACRNYLLKCNFSANKLEIILLTDTGSAVQQYTGKLHTGNKYAFIFSDQETVKRFEQSDASKFTEKIFDDPRCILQIENVATLIAIDEHRRLFVANDWYGVKAVYYKLVHDGIWLSDNLHSLIDKTGIDEMALIEHFMFGYTGEKTPYKGVFKLPAGHYLTIDTGITISSYRPAESLNKILDNSCKNDIITSFADAVRQLKMPFTTGLTSGKDSLAIASALKSKPVATTFGHANSSDVEQGRRIAAECGLHWKYASLCDVQEAKKYAHEIALRSAGLATASYMDMYKMFKIAEANIFLFGEGGECIRDFFPPGDSVRERLKNYVTPFELLSNLFEKQIFEEKNINDSNYFDRVFPGNLENNAKSLLEFYRYYRMSGNFAQRTSILNNKYSPFLATKFILATYDLNPVNFENSGIHRMIIESLNPDLLTFFDKPLQAEKSVQNWDLRMGAEIGRYIRDSITNMNIPAYLPFSGTGLINLATENYQKPEQRRNYFLLRVLSFLLFHNMPARPEPAYQVIFSSCAA